MILVHCSNQYQHVLRVSCTFVPINSFRQLLNVSPTTHVYSETSHLEFSFSEVCLTDQNSVPIEIRYIMRYSIEPRDRIYIFPLQKIMNKSLSIKYGQMLLDNFKTASERDI